MPRRRGSTCHGAVRRASAALPQPRSPPQQPLRAEREHRPPRTPTRARARSGASARLGLPPIRAARAPSARRGSSSRDAFTASTDAPPAGAHVVHARLQRRRLDHGRAVRRSAASANPCAPVRRAARARRARRCPSAAPRRQRTGIAGAKHAGVGHHGAPIAAARRRASRRACRTAAVGIGAHAAAKAPAPEAGRAEHGDAARRLPADERDAPLAARARLARDQPLPLAARQRRRHAERRQAVERQRRERRRERRRGRRGGEPFALVASAAARRAAARRAWRVRGAPNSVVSPCRMTIGASRTRGAHLVLGDARERAVGAPRARRHAIVGARRQRRHAAQRGDRLARVEVGRRRDEHRGRARARRPRRARACRCAARRRPRRGTTARSTRGALGALGDAAQRDRALGERRRARRTGCVATSCVVEPQLDAGRPAQPRAAGDDGEPRRRPCRRRGCVRGASSAATARSGAHGAGSDDRARAARQRGERVGVVELTVGDDDDRMSRPAARSATARSRDA